MRKSKYLFVYTLNVITLILGFSPKTKEKNVYTSFSVKKWTFKG